MSSELRIKCFLGEEGAGVHHERRIPAPDAKDWNTTGDYAQVRKSLSALLEQLEADSGDYLVKVVVHRKLRDPANVVPLRRPETAIHRLERRRLDSEQTSHPSEQEEVLRVEAAAS